MYSSTISVHSNHHATFHLENCLDLSDSFLANKLQNCLDILVLFEEILQML